MRMVGRRCACSQFA